MIKVNNKIFNYLVNRFSPSLGISSQKKYQNNKLFAFSIVQQFSFGKYKSQKQNDKVKQSSTKLKQKSNQAGQKQLIKVDYGQQINELLNKKQLSQIDLVFLSKMLHIKNFSISDEEKVSLIKKHLKKLTQLSFQNLIPLIDLSQKIGVIHFSPSLISCFVSHFTNNPIGPESIQTFANPFLKQACFLLFLENFKKKIDQGAEILKIFGTLLSKEQMKKVDNICCQSIKTMQINTVVRFLNIFRQLSRIGLFVELAGHVIIEKKDQLSNKYMLMALISLFELGSLQTAQQLQPLLLGRIQGQKALEYKDILVVLQIFHKFKKGSAKLWQNLQKCVKKKEIDIVFQHTFAILSGLTRNYVPRPSLLLELVMLQPTFDFVNDLSQKQFIQFFLVLYFHFQYSEPASTKKIEPFILEAIKSKEMKSIYFQIQNFFLFLFEKGSQKKDYLRKAYPNDMMVTLISLAYQIQQTVDITEANAYEQDLLARYPKQLWEKYKKTIVAYICELERVSRALDVNFSLSYFFIAPHTINNQFQNMNSIAMYQ